jgi:hypothetical protein
VQCSSLVVLCQAVGTKLWREGERDLILGPCQPVLSLDCPFDTGLRPTQGASSGALAVAPTHSVLRRVFFLRQMAPGQT